MRRSKPTREFCPTYPCCSVARAARTSLLVVTVAAIALAVYLRTLAPTITWAHSGADGGDLITAVVTLGIPHPTGYPTYVLLGRLFLLVPWGDAARRLNLMSAVFAALTVMLVYRLVLWTFRRFDEGDSGVRARLTAGAGALAFAFSPLLWSQAVITEVYTLNAFFTALTLYLVLRWSEGGRHRVLGLAAFVFGLGLGNHVTLSLLAPAILLLLWTERHRLLSAGVWRMTALPLLILLGLSVYVYVPLRAIHHPPVNWGAAHTLRGFRWLVTGRLYRRYFFNLPLRYVPSRISAWVTLLVQQVGWWGVFFGLVGAWSLWQRARRVMLFLAIVFVTYSVYAIGYDTSDSHVYLIPAFMAFAVWLSWGLIYLVGELKRLVAPRPSPLLRVLPLCLVLLVPLVPLVTNFSAMDLTDDHEARDYARSVLETVDAGAIVIPQTDGHNFSLCYVRYAQQRRTDIAVLDGELLYHAWYRRNAAHLHPDVVLSEPTVNLVGRGLASSFSLTGFIDKNLDRRPIYLTDPDAQLKERYRLAEEGPVYRVLGLRQG